MKHSELYNEYKKLDEIERQELIAAVKAHGGECIFIHTEKDYALDEQDDAPIVAACTRCMDQYEDFYISRVVLEDGKYLNIYGYSKEGCMDDENEIESIAHGHLGYIIDEIPETDAVKDVSSSVFAPQSILVFSREDVENIGYSRDMTPDQYKALVRAMKKSYEWNIDVYWDALKQACENVGINPLQK